jgi:Tol biopolymer transport system component
VHYVVEYPLDGGKETVIVPEMEKQVTSAAWFPDKGSLLLCLREVNAEVRQIWRYFPSTGEFKRITNDNNSYKGFSIARDGKSIVTMSENSYAAVWTAEDEKYNFKQITGGLNNFGVVGWTGDGRIIYSSTENGVEVVSIINADGSKPLQITSGNDGVRLYPRISPDGRSVVFASTRTGLRQLWRIDLDGRNLAQLTQTGDIYLFDGKILSDSQTVVFLGESKGADRRRYNDASRR